MNADKAEYPELDNMVYLSGAANDLITDTARTDLGLLCQPGNGVWRKANAYAWWAMDNGCFGENRPGGQPFNERKWLEQLGALTPERCLFVTCPDVLNWREIDGELVPVGDALATWRRSEPYIKRVQAMGYPAAVVLQDGVEHLPLVWRAILDNADAVFVGGSDAFKYGEAVPRLIADAQAHGLWAHVGRVNTKRGLVHFNEANADSCDGTYVRFGPTTNVPTLCRWLDGLGERGRRVA